MGNFAKLLVTSWAVALVLSLMTMATMSVAMASSSSDDFEKLEETEHRQIKSHPRSLKQSIRDDAELYKACKSGVLLEAEYHGAVFGIYAVDVAFMDDRFLVVELSSDREDGVNLYFPSSIDARSSSVLNFDKTVRYSRNLILPEVRCLSLTQESIEEAIKHIKSFIDLRNRVYQSVDYLKFKISVDKMRADEVFERNVTRLLPFKHRVGLFLGLQSSQRALSRLAAEVLGAQDS